MIICRYEKVDASESASNVEAPPSWGADDVEAWLRVQAESVNTAHTQGVTINVDMDLFSQGFDRSAFRSVLHYPKMLMFGVSLSATFLRNRIVSGLRSSFPEIAGKIAQNIIFEYPSIKELSAQIVALVSGADVQHVEGTSAIEQMIEKYSVGLGISNSGSQKIIPVAVTSTSTPVVLLTGSTGNLGSCMLEALLKDPGIERVYVYNRPARDTDPITSKDRQRSAFTDKSFELELLESDRLVYLEGDGALPKLGLTDEVYEQVRFERCCSARSWTNDVVKLRSSVTHIIHNAWRLDFNLSLASFEPNIRGTRNLIDLASHSEQTSIIRFLFTSTIGSAQGWDATKGQFPEEVQYDPATAVGGGYGEAKYVCERVRTIFRMVFELS